MGPTLHVDWTLNRDVTCALEKECLVYPELSTVIPAVGASLSEQGLMSLPSLSVCRLVGVKWHA